MRVNAWCLATSLLSLLSTGFAYPRPLPGTEDIPKLMSVSSLVCKGEVVEAPAPVFVNSSNTVPPISATAQVHPDRCFKGTPQVSFIPVLFDGVTTCCGPSFVLRKGDYRLFFLTPQDGKFAVVDVWFGALPISREISDAPEGADPLYLLELDLEAGLRDSNPEHVLDTIQMLGNMGHLHSTAELKRLATSPDMLVKTYVWQALLRLKDYAILPAVAAFFDDQPAPPHELYLPRDRVFQMQFELQSAMATIRDPSTLPYLERFAISGRDYRLRSSALQSLRAINSLQSAATFLKELDDPNADNAFSAMQGLLSLAGGGAIEWVPSWKQFDETPQYYAAKCREWWTTEGAQKAKSQAQRTLRFVLTFPKGARADLVQIHYLAIRSGNGYGDILRQQATQNAYEFAEPGEKLKVAAYIPGCQFDTLELSAGMTTTQPLLCRPLRSVQLSGYISNADLVVGKSAVVEASYVAHWVRVFFGIADGPVTTFQLPPSGIDSNGAFTLSLPDFANDTMTKRWKQGGEWQFIIRELRTRNVLGRLRPADSDGKASGLTLQSSYPEVVKFTVVPN
jgi:hypothetical protein